MSERGATGTVTVSTLLLGLAACDGKGGGRDGADAALPCEVKFGLTAAP